MEQKSSQEQHHRYHTSLGPRNTLVASGELKRFFSQQLCKALSLTHIDSCPLIVLHESGINDDLDGKRKPVQFAAGCAANGQPLLPHAEVVQALSKWKRSALVQLHMDMHEGIVCDMRAIRKDTNLDNVHSAYVDQWDWEHRISDDERTLDTLKSTVAAIWRCIKETERFIEHKYPMVNPQGKYQQLPQELLFVHSQDLLDAYPDLSPNEREEAVLKQHGAIFLWGIGCQLSNGERHEQRAPDYDDWSTETRIGGPDGVVRKGLNGDILVWNPVTQRRHELSSMGIRVSPEVLRSQLEETGFTERAELPFHRNLLSGELPMSIGGGIGQSRLVQFLLRKWHVGEVIYSVWPEEMVKDCKERGIELLV